MTAVVFSPEALEDLGAALLYLRKRRPSAALRLREAVESAVSLLAEGSVDGPEVTLQTGERVRRWLVKPYAIYYERRPDAVWIDRIYHGRRAPIAR